MEGSSRSLSRVIRFSSNKAICICSRVPFDPESSACAWSFSSCSSPLAHKESSNRLRPPQPDGIRGSEGSAAAAESVVVALWASAAGWFDGPASTVLVLRSSAATLRMTSRCPCGGTPLTGAAPSRSA
eukprot:scaffold5178_cov364-Prasinococcus_capsulatus_cf.AAC.4